MLELYNQFVVVVENADKLTAAALLIFGKVVSGATFLPGTPLTLLSGVVLGPFWGTIVALIGNTIGAVVAFVLARYFLKNFVQKKILAKYPKINEYEDRLFKNGFYTVVFLRLIPLFPFNALNFILGVTEVRFRDYLFGTVLGMIPGTFMFVYLGDSVKMLSFWNVMFALFGIIGLGYLGRMWKL